MELEGRNLFISEYKPLNERNAGTGPWFNRHTSTDIKLVEEQYSAMAKALSPPINDAKKPLLMAVFFFGLTKAFKGDVEKVMKVLMEKSSSD